MPYGLVSKFANTITSAASTVSFDIVKSWTKVYAEISTFSTAAQVNVFGSTDGTTWWPLWERVNTATAGQHNTFVINSGHVTAGGIVPILPGLQYYQFRASATVTDGATFNLICSD